MCVIKFSTHSLLEIKRSEHKEFSLLLNREEVRMPLEMHLGAMCGLEVFHLTQQTGE